MNRAYRGWCRSIREMLHASGYRVAACRFCPNWPQVRQYWHNGVSPPVMARRLIDAGMARPVKQPLSPSAPDAGTLK